MVCPIAPDFWMSASSDGRMMVLASSYSDLPAGVSIVQAVTMVGSAALLSMTGSTTLVWLSFPISEIVIFALSLAFLNCVYKENSLAVE